jgi:eukaryotic-like serine/threonine-protein kinase
MKECQACQCCFPDELTSCPNDGGQLVHSLPLAEPLLDNRYQLEQRLGQGGMGLVYKARHTFLKTTHAVKVILPDLVGNDPSLVTRFRQEAMAAAAIRHQNIVSVTDFGVAAGIMPFLVMEFIKGVSLQDILTTEGRLSPERTLEILSGVCAGVGAAHRQGIVHRDLKPLNIMIQDGMPLNEAIKVLDFGLAKIKSGEWLGSFVQAQTTGLMGSPYYMAPEQWSDEEPDMRADVYSLGIIIYQMLTGDVPFKGSSMPSIMKKHLTNDPPSFSSVGIHLPFSIEKVVRYALEKDPNNRPSSVGDLVRELQQAVSSISTIDMGATQKINTVSSPPSTQPTGINAAGTVRLLPEEMRSGTETLKESKAEISGRQVLENQDSQNLENTRVKQLDTIASQNYNFSKVEEKPLVIKTYDSGKAVESEKRSKSLIFPIAIVIALIAIGSLGYFVYRNRQASTPAQVKDNIVPSSQTLSIKSDMVEIQGGTFKMGRDYPPSSSKVYNDSPSHEVTVKSFFIDRTEITNAEYADFVRETNYPSPDGINWSGNKPLDTELDLPVRSISFQDVQSFVAWRSKRDNVNYRLPSEEEWEYVARGGESNNLYPWGQEWSEEYSNLWSDGPKPVGSYKNIKTAWNVTDMIGNVWEWTSSTASIYPGNKLLKLVPEQKNFIVVRGGSYQSMDPKAVELRGSKEFPATTRQWVAPSTKNKTLGFRLVRDL